MGVAGLKDWLAGGLLESGISGCLSCGPGARALRAESIDWASPFPGGSVRLPQKAAGPWAIRRIAPTQIQPEDMLLALCPPVPWNQRRLMVSARNALASGPGTASKASFRWGPFASMRRGCRQEQ